MTTPAFLPPQMTIKRFSEWSALGRTKIYDEIKSGRLKTIKVGSRRLVPGIEAQRWLESYGVSTSVASVRP